jgi:hypothetical protein
MRAVATSMFARRTVAPLRPAKTTLAAVSHVGTMLAMSGLTLLHAHRY